MMKKRKSRWLVTIIILASIVSASSIYASSHNKENNEAKKLEFPKTQKSSLAMNNSNSESTTVIPDAVKGRIENRSVTGTSALLDFDIPVDDGVIKLYLANTGSTHIQWQINYGSPAGPKVAGGTVTSGSKPYDKVLNPEPGNGWKDGDYYLSLTSGTGDMHGVVGVDLFTEGSF